MRKMNVQFSKATKNYLTVVTIKIKLNINISMDRRMKNGTGNGCCIMIFLELCP